MIHIALKRMVAYRSQNIVVQHWPLNNYDTELKIYFSTTFTIEPLFLRSGKT